MGKSLFGTKVLAIYRNLSKLFKDETVIRNYKLTQGIIGFKRRYLQFTSTYIYIFYFCEKYIYLQVLK